MTKATRPLSVLGILLLLLVGCGGSDLPPLGEPGQPSLVFIYTDN